MKQPNLIAIEPWWLYCFGLFSDGTVKRICLDGISPVWKYHTQAEPALDWSNICMLDSSRSHVVGLGTDGKVNVYSNDYLFEAYQNWQDIIQVKAGYEITAGLTGTGKVLCEFNGSRSTSILPVNHVKMIASQADHVVGLCEDGNLFCGINGKVEIVANSWNDVEIITATADNIFGLQKSGNIRSLYKNAETEKWEKIIFIDSGNNHIAGLQAEGTVVADGINNCNQCDVQGWENIKKLFAGCYHTVALSQSGYITSTLNNWN